MKTITLLLAIFLTGIFMKMNAQTANLNDVDKSGLRISARIGYDVPAFGNNTPYVDYKGGLEAGASVDYYWDWIGIGGDFDYIQNQPRSTYPTTNLFLGTGGPPTFSLTENKITRMFYGIGPSFKYQKTNKASWELKLRAGLSSIKDGKTELIANSAPGTLLNFHAGYDVKNSFATKASLQYNRFFNKNFGMFLGAYYMQHYKVPELVEPTYGIAAGYMPFTTDQEYNIVNDQFAYRDEACNCEIHSIGVYAGVVLAFGGAKKVPVKDACPVCGKVHYPFCCTTCGCDVTITARDKFTKELLNNTDVVLKDSSGNVAQTGTTNSFGVVVFKNVQADNYTIAGKLYETALATNSIAVEEFDDCKTSGVPIQKEILYTDENFIINGKVVVCNTNQAINDVQVTLKNNQAGIQKTTNTDAKGDFMFYAAQNVNYSLFGKKGNYFSQTETLLTKDYDRTKTLFIKLEVCMQEVDCGKAIVLENILYDLDKYFIREDAKPELNRLVQFLNDNAGVKIELSSHTDSRSSNAYNQTLSQNRANSAVDYLVSQGISRSRIIGKGYGESKLLNKCADGASCSEAEHQINRRTEMRVICPE